MPGGPLPRVALSRLYVRVPVAEWIEVKHGTKREFRTGVQNNLHVVNGQIELPTPVVAYSSPGHDARVMVCTEAWKEPLGAISPESLANEGVETLAEFKQRWCARRERRFNPLKHVVVYRVRPWSQDDEARFAKDFLEKLYPTDLRP